jgi:S-adenosylmethionine:tRNA ribosyltransferase-isomerase
MGFSPDVMGAGLRTADYEFVLPADRIAQVPAERRDESRLMVVDRVSGAIAHRRFRDLPELAHAGDLMVVNTTRVFRARLLGRRDSGAPAAGTFRCRPTSVGRTP